jgi:hypothetical protein
VIPLAMRSARATGARSLYHAPTGNCPVKLNPHFLGTFEAMGRELKRSARIVLLDNIPTPCSIAANSAKWEDAWRRV